MLSWQANPEIWHWLVVEFGLFFPDPLVEKSVVLLRGHPGSSRWMGLRGGGVGAVPQTAEIMILEKC